ncbi:MAG: type II toxin-antitoxin system Phd/YefM family antitoxin [Candidatus Xenobia bacterium]
MRKSVGLFEAKTRLSELCEQVAQTRQPVTVTRRGRPLVRILPAEEPTASIWERREAYLKAHRSEREDARDFQVSRSTEVSQFKLEG